MSSYPPYEKLQVLKRRMFAKYCDKHWFGGCRINTDEPVACLELLKAPDMPMRSFKEDCILVRAVSIDWSLIREHQETWKDAAFDAWCRKLKEACA